MRRPDLSRLRLLAIGLSLAFAVNCRTADTSVRVEKTTQGLNENDSLIERSNLTPEEKAAGKKNNENARVLIKDQNTEIQEKTVEIKRLEWYENIFWQAVMTLGGIALGAFGYWFFFRR